VSGKKKATAATARLFVTLILNISLPFYFLLNTLKQTAPPKEAAGSSEIPDGSLGEAEIGRVGGYLQVNRAA
jgi:hypothetical protein